MNVRNKEVHRKYISRKKEEWIRPDTWKKIDERKAVKQRINSTKSERIKDQLKGKYSLLDREVKALARADKRAYVDGLADEAEAAAGRQDVRTLYKTVESTVPAANQSKMHQGTSYQEKLKGQRDGRNTLKLY